MGAAMWAGLAASLKQILLPSFEKMMGDAAQDAMAQLPFSVGVDLDAINAEVSEWANEYVGELVTNVNDTTKDRVRVAVQNWVDAGGDMPALVSKMNDIFDAPWRAKMVAVTEVTRAFAYAKEKAWSDSRVIKKKRWQTAADDLVCPICGPLQGVTRTLGKAFPGGIENPPAHPNCRCWLTPVVGD